MSHKKNCEITILSVDDMLTNLLTLEVILDEHEYLVESINSGRAAIEYLRNNQPHIILLDINMPVMSGLETARLIRQNESSRRIPIIFISADLPNQLQMVDYHQLKMVDFLIKPIEPEMLFSKVEQLLNSPT